MQVTSHDDTGASSRPYPEGNAGGGSLSSAPLQVHHVNLEPRQAGKLPSFIADFVKEPVLGEMLDTSEKQREALQNHNLDTKLSPPQPSTFPAFNKSMPSPSLEEQQVVQMEMLRHENERMRSQHIKLIAELKAANSASLVEKETMNQELLLSVELCAVLRLQNKYLIDWITGSSSNKSLEVCEISKCFTESCIRAEMELISGELSSNLDCHQGAILQNTSKCWIAQLTDSTRTAITKHQRAVQRNNMQLQQQIQHDMEALNASVTQKMNRILSSLSYLDERHQTVSERFCVSYKHINSQRILSERRERKCGEELKALKSDNEALVKTLEQVQRQNTSLNVSLKVLKQRLAQVSVMSSLESRAGVVVKEIQAAVAKVRLPAPHVLKDESFLETLRLAALRAEAQVDILSSLLHSLANYVNKHHRGSSKPHQPKASGEMTAHQAEYYGKMKRLLSEESQKKCWPPAMSDSSSSSHLAEGDEAVCKSLFSPFLSSPEDDAVLPIYTIHTTREPSHRTKNNTPLEEHDAALAYVMGKGKIRDVIHNIRCYAQHLKNIYALLENDSKKEQKFSQELSVVVHGFEGYLKQFSTDMLKLIHNSVEDQEM